MSAATDVRIGIAGAGGKMGGVVTAAVLAQARAVLPVLFDQPGAVGSIMNGHEMSSRDAALQTCDVIIDFTRGPASAELARICAERGGPALVIGSTGFSEVDEAEVLAAARRIAILRSGNFSLGVNVLLGLVARAARALPASAYDIEISEQHHSRKIDAPSGTALMLGAAAAGGRGVRLKDVEVRARDGVGEPRVVGSIGFSSLRLGDVIGEHEVKFAARDEIITLSHSARDRSLFARGAVEAAAWLAGKPAGLYDMQDVLGMKD